MSTRLDLAGLTDFIERFDSDAFRCEILDAYDVPSDRGELGRYLAGEPGPESETVTPWGQWVRDARARRATVRRLRVILAPPSDYLRFEAEWIYTANAAAGEEIRVLDLTDRSVPVVPDCEFWMLDHARAAVLTYEEDGQFAYASALDEAEARDLCADRDAAWQAAEPFTEWWERHPELHRANRHNGARVDG